MQGYNCIAVINKDNDKWLMCLRKKNPYKGLLNLVGGKIEDGEDYLSSAYRELFEETSISDKDINLLHIMDFNYPLDDCFVQVYAGKLKYDIQVFGDENELKWIDLNENFFDTHKYAGEGNIGHMLEHIKIHQDKLGQGGQNDKT